MSQVLRNVFGVHLNELDYVCFVADSYVQLLQYLCSKGYGGNIEPHWLGSVVSYEITEPACIVIPSQSRPHLSVG